MKFGTSIGLITVIFARNLPKTWRNVHICIINDIRTLYGAVHVESIRLCTYHTTVGMEGIIIQTAKIARNWRKHD
jgi:hypothetical protein